MLSGKASLDPSAAASTGALHAACVTNYWDALYSMLFFRCFSGFKVVFGSQWSEDP
jgi:hypothetical protein